MARRRWPVNGPITSRFGSPFYMDSGATYQGRRYAHFNKGVDFGVGGGTPVQAPVAGRVKLAADDGQGWGPRVVIVDAEGFEHSLGHLGSIYVKPGQDIAEGAVVALVGHGAVGTSTGAHLSYDIFRGGEPVDPSPWLGEDVKDPAISHDPSRAQLPGFAGGENVSASFTEGASASAGSNMATTLTSSQQQMANLIAARARAYALSQGLDEAMAGRFARTMVAIAYQESDLGAAPVGDGGSSRGLFHTHIGGRNLSGLGKQTGSVQELAQVLSDPEVDIRNSLPELFGAFQQSVGTQGLGFDQDAVTFVKNVMRIGQRPEASALAAAGPKLAAGLTLPVDTAGVGNVLAPGQGTIVQPSVTNLPSAVSAGANALPPAATPADALESLITKQITTLATSDDPTAVFQVPALSAALQQVRVLKGEASPDTIADIASREKIANLQTGTDKEIAMLNIATQLGINQNNIAAEKDNLNTRLAFEAEQNSKDRAIRVMEVTGSQQIARDRLEFDREEAARTYGIDLRRLTNEERAQAASEVQFTERLDFDKLQADRGYGIDLERLGIEKQRFGLEQQEALRLEKKDTLSALVDLIRVQVDAGQISESAAEKALDKLVDIYLSTGGGLDYMPGMEPGGVYATALGKIGGTYNPGAFRIRPFPMDLQSMAQSMGKFDLSNAWNTARGLLGQAGFNTGSLPQQGFTPPAGGSLQGQFQGQGQSQQPSQQQFTPPQGLPGQAGVPATYGQPAQQAPPSMTAQPGTGAPAMTGTSPLMQPQPQSPDQDPHAPCPMGQQRIWDGHRFLCR